MIRRLSLALSLTLLTPLTLPLISAHAAGTPIACWIPQAVGWAPTPPSAFALNHTPAQAAKYSLWYASSTRIRSWDKRYEVVMHSDTGSASFCVEVFPGSGLYVYRLDLPNVLAYFRSLNQVAPDGTGTDGISVVVDGV